jgi:ureidoacrylate peracid hydrolase
MKRIYFIVLFFIVFSNIAYNQIKSGKMEKITIAAKPCAIQIDAVNTAVIVIDMQNDFGAKNGIFDHAGIDISSIQKAVAPTSRVLAEARKKNIKIIYLKMGFQADLSDLGIEGSPNHDRHIYIGVGNSVTAPDGSKSRFLIRDTWNTEILPELKPMANDLVLYKHRFSGFYQTALDSILKKLGVKYLIITGCTTSVCVESTVRDAMFRDYSCIILEDCTAEPIGNNFTRTNHQASLLLMQTLLGWVSDSSEFIKSLKMEAVAIH